MSSGRDRHAPDEDPTACGYTSYDPADDEKQSAAGEVPATGEGAEGVERDVWTALYAVEDPEMPVSIVDLGLIYGVTVDDGVATIDMTLTYTGCPARDMLLGDVKQAVSAVDGVDRTEITMVWSPGWTVDMVTEQGKDALREFGLSV